MSQVDRSSLICGVEMFQKFDWIDRRLRFMPYKPRGRFPVDLPGGGVGATFSDRSSLGL